ncbi:hypothetical protein AVDCRST_MAG81-2978 [uncultured Synechococcales cyanobacterium]|uniref:Uncharacterized protein n=1 Tax=uncultured Synechococcales cyanobacterium TaxID=1936017 RepID=A0A6J4V9N2_9CYAN|nr:hypothetical protein AVDCRST_MAG81-2978 [uncultured Synechococcales cyanobacterium]
MPFDYFDLPQVLNYYEQSTSPTLTRKSPLAARLERGNLNH